MFHTDDSPVCKDDIDAMLNAIAHRGPDGAGQWRNGAVALGQLCRHITCESRNEQPPVHDADAGFVLVANCRLTNRDDLCNALAIPLAEGTQIADSRLLLLAYRKWQARCVEHLVGAFAVVVWNERDRSLFCASDHMGLCPLYTYQDGLRFIFATEIKAILAHPAVSTRLNERKLARLVVPASPILDKEATYFENIFQIPAATILTVTQRHVRRDRYWNPDPGARLSLKPAEVFEAFRELWFNVISANLRSDFPVAALLSGGLDSSAIVASAAHILRQRNQQLITLSAVLPQHSTTGVKDERRFIDEFKGWDNIERVFVTDQRRGPFDDLEQRAWGAEVPTNTLCHYLYSAFAEAASERQARVILDGVGGELGPTFHGDGCYAEMFLKGQWWQFTSGLRKDARRRRVSWWHNFRHQVAQPLGGSLWRRWTGRLDLSLPQAQYQPLQAEFVAGALGDSVNDIAAAVARLGEVVPRHRVNQSRSILMAQTYPDNFFGGYENVQVALPYFDKRVLEFCLAAPGSSKVHNGYSRYLVRGALAGILPSAIQWRTSKTPFSPDLYLRYNRQRPQVQALLAAIPASDPVRRIVDVEKLKRMAVVEMPPGWNNTPAHQAPVNTIRGVYLIAFLRRFAEYAPT